MFWKRSSGEVIRDKERVDVILSRGVGEVVNLDDLRKEMLSGKRLRIKLGIDPTSPDIHLGRAVILYKLRDFQKLGHQIVLIIGDATGVIGDTSDKESERPMLSKEVVKNNANLYFKQAGKLLDMGKVETHYNSEWLNKLSYDEIGEHADQFSVAEFIARDNIRKRLDKGQRVSLREVLYPLMQGYDSVAVHADVELGGTDQRFNLLAGRVLQSKFKQKPQNILMMGLIEGTDGRKMSSSWENVIKLNDSSGEMYGKIMSLPDNLMEKYFISLTRVEIKEIEKIKKGHPRDMKMCLAKEVVTIYHGAEEAERAENGFVSTFQKKEVPDDVTVVTVNKGELAVDVFVKEGVVKSKSEFRRLVDDNGIKIIEADEKVNSHDFSFSKDSTFKIGKRRFIKVKVK